MKSQKIVDYYNFLEEEDDNYKGNSEIIDDGSEALYCILFNLLGDKRSLDELINIFDFPTPTELHYSAEGGDYSSIFPMAEEHGCELIENGASQNITTDIIQKLEEYLPALTDRIKSQELAKNSEFLLTLIK